MLLLGETGTGKELFATRIHELSARRRARWCGSTARRFPPTLIESELFGRERGAFTDALARQIGRFELADQSTIFLDEIGDLPPDVQVKLLRVLEERQIERLGSPRAIRVDTRIIAATHRDLEQRVADGTFREDLFYRLNVFPDPRSAAPGARRGHPARSSGTSWWTFSKALGKRIETIPQQNMQALLQYPWPGNVRELRNVVERAMILANGPRLTIEVPTATPARTAGRSAKLVDVEKEHIRSVLESAGWRIRGAGGAAERLGLRPTTLETRMAKLGLVRPKACARRVARRGLASQPESCAAARSGSTVGSADRDRLGELELQPRFRRQLQVLFAARRDGGAGHAADRRADRRALAAAGDAADDRAEAGAAADLPAVRLPSPLPLVSTYGGRHLVDHPAEARRCSASA